MALVECTVGATTQVFDGVEYQFKKDANNRFVALIHKHEHLEGFLASPYYRVVDNNDQAEANIVEEADAEEMFEDETDEQIAERLRVETEEANTKAAMQAQADAQAAESAKITEDIANGRTIVIEQDEYTLAQMPTVDPTRTEETAPADEDAELDGDEETIIADHLTEISGIGETVQEILNDAGIYTFEDLANASDETLDNLNETYKMRNSHVRFNWREAAKKLAQETQE